MLLETMTTTHVLSLYKKLYKELARGKKLEELKRTGNTQQFLWGITQKEKLSFYDPRLLEILFKQFGTKIVIQAIREDARVLRTRRERKE